MNRNFARHLRNNMTDAERRLWLHLRCEQMKGFKFRRQTPIGDYIVDFVCFPAKLIVELDGGQHAEQEEYDEARDAWLESQGFKVLCFWNKRVFEEMDNVLEAIWEALPDVQGERGSNHPSPALPIEGREQET